MISKNRKEREEKRDRITGGRSIAIIVPSGCYLPSNRRLVIIARGLQVRFTLI